MKSINKKSLFAIATLLGSAFLASAQVGSTSLGAGNTNFGNFSLASGGFNTIYGGYGNHALGWSNTIGTGSFNLLAGLQNSTAGDFNFVTGAGNQPSGAYNLVGGQNNVGAGSLNLVFGVFANAGATAGKVILTDSNPLIPTAVRSAANRFTPAGADRFAAAFNEGYFLNTNSLQGANAGAGLVIIPSVANTATTSSPAFVGINTATQARLPAQALDVVGNGVFTGASGNFLVNSGSAPAGGTTLMGTFTGAAAGPQVRFARTTGGVSFWDIGEDGGNNFVVERGDVNFVTILQSGNCGINNPSPQAMLDVVGGANFSGDVAIGPLPGPVVSGNLTVTGSGNSNQGTVVVDLTGADGTLVRFRRDGSTVGSIDAAAGLVTYNAFTGSHYARAEETIERGMLVSLTGRNGRLEDKPGSEILYGIAKSRRENDPAIMGAYLARQNPAASAIGESANPHLVEAVGNGGMWVIDTGRDLKAGEYLLSSAVEGHAMTDPGTFDVSYIVARVAEPVAWKNVTSTVKGTDGRERKRALVSVFFENFVIDRTASRSKDAEIAALKKQLAAQAAREKAIEARLARLEQAATAVPVALKR